MTLARLSRTREVVFLRVQTFKDAGFRASAKDQLVSTLYSRGSFPGIRVRLGGQIAIGLVRAVGQKVKPDHYTVG